MCAKPAGLVLLDDVRHVNHPTHTIYSTPNAPRISNTARRQAGLPPTCWTLTALSAVADMIGLRTTASATRHAASMADRTLPHIPSLRAKTTVYCSCTVTGMDVRRRRWTTPSPRPAPVDINGHIVENYGSRSWGFESLRAHARLRQVGNDHFLAARPFSPLSSLSVADWLCSLARTSSMLRAVVSCSCGDGLRRRGMGSPRERSPGVWEPVVVKP